MLGCGRGELTRPGFVSQDEALKAHEIALEKSAGLGSKIDLRLTMIRIGFFHADHAVIQTNIDKAAL